jgi:hypothetical protein
LSYYLLTFFFDVRVRSQNKFEQFVAKIPDEEKARTPESYAKEVARSLAQA